MIRFVDRGDWLLGDKPAVVLHRDGKRFWKRAGLSAANGAAAIYGDDGEVIAFLRFHVRRGPSGAHLHALGSWVHPQHRGRRHAWRLWHYAIRQLKVTSVSVCTVSPAGRRLIARVVASHFSVSFNIT